MHPAWKMRLARLALSPTLILVLALLSVGNTPAIAGEGFRLSGFGTLGYAEDNRSDLAPTRDISQQPAHGYATGASWQLDSRLGVQLEYGLSQNIDLVGQFVFRDQFKADLNSTTELAYVALRPQPHVDLRVGRISYDAFLMSEYRNVGYAYIWVRPPPEFYGWIPVFSVDGMDAAYNINTDAAHWRFKAQLADSKLMIPIGAGYDFRANNLLGLSVSRQSTDWRLKAAYSQFTIGSEVPAFASLHAGLDSLAAAAIPLVSAEAADLRRNLSFMGARVSYATLGAAYDDGTWVAQAELGCNTSTAAVVSHGSTGYLSVGRRFGDWTPYLMLAASRPGNGRRSAANDWGAYNRTLRDPALYTVNTTRIEQDTVSVGTRWDFRRNAALKLQWDSTAIKASGYGLWWRAPGINGSNSRVAQLSATLDFEF